MIVQKELLNRLKDFGLNSYESKLWIALLSRGVSTAGELSDISSVPRSRTYDVLESLERKGFIVMKVGKPIKYLALPPAEAVERVKKKVMVDAEEQNKILTNLKGGEVLEQLNTLHTEGIKLIDPTDKSGAFRGQDKAHEHLVLMIKNAKKSLVLAMNSKESADRKLDVLGGFLRRAAKAGVEVKVGLPSTVGSETMAVWSKFAKVKPYKDSARFCLVDNKELLLFLTDDTKVHKNYDCAVWVEAPQFVEHFSSLVEKEWKAGK